MAEPFDTSTPILPEIWQRHAAQQPTKPALIADGETLNWGDLVTEVHAFARGLLVTGIKPGDRVGLIMSNGAPMVIALMGLAAAGVASVPLNLMVTDHDMASIVANADCRAIIVSTDQVRRAEGLGAALPDKRILVGDERADWYTFQNLIGVGLRNTAALPTLNPGALMNIIYSSGTTGVPKGIMHSYRGRRAMAADLAIALRYAPTARTLFTIGLYSNISWVGLMATLLVGGTLVIAKGFDAGDVLHSIAHHRITNFSMVPVQYQRLMAHPEWMTTDLSSLHAVMSCGASLGPDMKKALMARLGPRVIELYGLTEGLMTTLQPEDAADRWSSVGKPVSGTEIRLIDSGDQLIEAADTPGEIIGRGRLAMVGYWDNQPATDEAIWRAPDGEAWLRSGDIGQFDGDGFLTITDRKKDMIVSGGQNIYPQDIERTLITHEAVSEVAVVGAASARWQETPVGFIVTTPNTAPPNPASLCDWANRRLGKHQRLTDIILVNTLPRNANGKVLKRELAHRLKDKIYD